MRVPLTFDAIEENLKVFIRPNSEFYWQVKEFDYGLIEKNSIGELTDGNWVQVKWKNENKTYRNSYHYYNEDTEEEYDLLYEKQEQLEFEF